MIVLKNHAGEHQPLISGWYNIQPFGKDIARVYVEHLKDGEYKVMDNRGVEYTFDERTISAMKPQYVGANQFESQQKSLPEGLG